MNLSELIKKYRNSSLDDLQKRTKMSKGFLSRAENGNYDSKNISLSTIIKLAHGLDLTVKEILDELNITKNESSPSLNVYLRDKFNITSSEDANTIRSIIDKFRK